MVSRSRDDRPGAPAKRFGPLRRLVRERGVHPPSHEPHLDGLGILADLEQVEREHPGSSSLVLQCRCSALEEFPLLVQLLNRRRKTQ